MSSAVELFLDNCGEISDEGLIMFLLADSNYPFKKLLSKKLEGRELDPNNNKEDIEQVKKHMMAFLSHEYPREAKIKCLALHDMFR